jgi:regulator of protease activity HflC (stomatin/prohibitin superfamily)
MSIIALIGISSILKGSIFIVNPGERGLIINLGKLQDELLMKVFILLFPMFLLAKK